jgi:hypothetical protein
LPKPDLARELHAGKADGIGACFPVIKQFDDFPGVAVRADAPDGKILPKKFCPDLIVPLAGSQADADDLFHAVLPLAIIEPVVLNGVDWTGLPGLPAKRLFLRCLRLPEHKINPLLIICPKVAGSGFMTECAADAKLIDIKLSRRLPGDSWSACSHASRISYLG